MKLIILKNCKAKSISYYNEPYNIIISTRYYSVYLPYSHIIYESKKTYKL